MHVCFTEELSIDFHDAYGSGHDGVAVLLPGFAIIR